MSVSFPSATNALSELDFWVVELAKSFVGHSKTPKVLATSATSFTLISRLDKALVTGR
jgi:hypothetical protein